ncbi:YbaN family protein [Emcibacter sp. SYSU 3D8]|uniref:YbaN family protein n=1 Tax=Emcibacter sp. SYSU 3D8 TaxID=3133969 RepID=UPI0031FEB16E
MDPQDNPTEITVSPFWRYILLAVGWLFLAIGAIGAFLPILPTVPFLLITAWAWSKSSRRLHRWLYRNKTCGPYLVAWNKHGVIPPRAKVLAIGTMTVGWLFLTIYVATSFWVPLIVGAIEVAVSTFILTRPSRAPHAPPSN